MVSKTNCTRSIFEELNMKFTNNLQNSLNEEKESLARVEIKARKFSILGQIIRETNLCNTTQKELLVIFEISQLK